MSQWLDGITGPPVDPGIAAIFGSSRAEFLLAIASRCRFKEYRTTDWTLTAQLPINRRYVLPELPHLTT